MRLKAGCKKYKGYLRGDEKNGEISSDGVVGTYEVNSDSVKITITKKPLAVIPNFVIEKEIRAIFNEINL